METILTNDGPWIGIIGSISLLLLTHLTRNYIIPFLQVGKRRQYARYIAAIADEVTDDLKARYPENEWLSHLDDAVDRIIEVCEISPEIARRAAHAATYRKG